jgi:hypothetical protein
MGSASLQRRSVGAVTDGSLPARFGRSARIHGAAPGNSGELVPVRVIRVTGTTMIGQLADRAARAR